MLGAIRRFDIVQAIGEQCRVVIVRWFDGRVLLADLYVQRADLRAQVAADVGNPAACAFCVVAAAGNRENAIALVTDGEGGVGQVSRSVATTSSTTATLTATPG